MFSVNSAIWRWAGVASAVLHRGSKTLTPSVFSRDPQVGDGANQVLAVKQLDGPGCDEGFGAEDFVGRPRAAMRD